MAQLDKLLSVMVSNRAEALVLDEGGPATLDLQGTPRPVTRAPLTGAQVAALLTEIAPEESRRNIEGELPATFTYVTVDGAFAVRAMRENTSWRVTISIDDKAEFKRMTGQFKALTGFEPTSMGSADADAALGAAYARNPTPAASPAIPPAAPVAAPAPVAAAPASPPAALAPAAMPETDEAEAKDAIVAFAGSDRARAQLDELLTTMVQRGSSDLHLRVGEPPIVRLHGEMVRMEDRPALRTEDVSIMLRSIMPDRNRAEFKESNDTDYAYEIPGVARFRANAARDRMGPNAVFRQIPATVVSVEQMNVTQEVQRLCYLTKGLVLVTGPTGSGKSTTLCALIDLVNRARNDHVITIEDPIEFVHPNKNCIITQRQVGVHTKSFKAALRAALREDPDIILVGELRDLETVSIAIETAETGHLVFGTLHTTTAAGTIDRLIDQFPADRQSQIRVMLSESLKGVVSQTLCKKIGGGRVAAREILLSIPAISNLIREGKTFQIQSIMQTSKRFGMVTLADALIEYVDAGVVEPKEAYMKAVDKLAFVQMLKARGHDASFAEQDMAPAGTQPGAPAAGAAPAAKPGMAAKR
ncbi:MAG: twitching motility protein [Gemmatimonadetes bacterium]|nr:twitching motility protein [Gemmatimonadota bacterium]